MQMQYIRRLNFVSTWKYNQKWYSFETETFRKAYRNDAFEKPTAGKQEKK